MDGLTSSELSPTALHSVRTIGVLIASGFSPEEAADRLGMSRHEVRRRLGELRAELEQAAGIRGEATLTEERRDRVVAAKQAGEKTNSIARREGVSTSLVISDLKARGVPRR